MILLMRNTVNEFVPGCDLTLVRVDAALVGIVAQRARQCARARQEDRSLAELRFWDQSPQCILMWLEAGAADAAGKALQTGDGWAVLGDDALGSFEAANVDCTQMAILASDSPALGCSYRVGSEPIRAFDVPLAELGRRLGSPLGDPLRAIP